MIYRPIHDEVMASTARLAQMCHTTVAAKYKHELERYARLSTACDALESFLGGRPRDDDDVFHVLAERRMQIADAVAQANLMVYLDKAPTGLYLAVPYFPRCSDKQPLFLVNHTESAITYLGRKLYAYASTDDGIDEYRTSGNAFADGIAAISVIGPGAKLRIEDYSMSFDGDFVSNRRVILLINSLRTEWFTSISKLGGFLRDEGQHGLHPLVCVDGMSNALTET